jgi:hypothetical protein
MIFSIDFKRNLDFLVQTDNENYANSTTEDLKVINISLISILLLFNSWILQLISRKNDEKRSTSSKHSLYLIDEQNYQNWSNNISLRIVLGYQAFRQTCNKKYMKR